MSHDTLVAIVLALLGALLVWLIDPFLGWFLHGFAGYVISRLVPDLLPRNLRGNWDTKFWKLDKEYNERANVKQLLTRCRGTVHLLEPDRTYVFRGSIRGNVFVATYELIGQPERMDRGSFTLKLKDDGDKMLGRYSWTDSHTDEVCSDRYEWKRVSAE